MQNSVLPICRSEKSPKKSQSKVMTKKKAIPRKAVAKMYTSVVYPNGDALAHDLQDTDMLDIDFEWFDPQPQVDFHGIKTLLRQLFDADSQLLDLSALTDIILAQPLLGSTVKVDGNETDPYAFLSVLNLYEHKVCELRVQA